MKPIVHLSDLHLGVIRSAGTTPATAYLLRQNLLADFSLLLDAVGQDDLIINGDLFDTPAVPLSDLFAAFMALSSWLGRTEATLWLPPGNHDLSKNSQTYTSFDTLAALLRTAYGDRVQVPRVGQVMRDGLYVIPHVANADLLQLELSKIPANTTYIFLHANYSNNFAAKSDHSLNISEEQAKSLPGTLVFAHEHQRKQALGGKVQIVGNQLPSSVSDCLGNSNKVFARVSDAGIEYIETWSTDEDFAQLDWNLLEDTGANFIRVIGKATAAEGAAVVAAISKFRQISKALVVTNAVEIEGETNEAEIALTMEKLTSFNVMEELMKLFNEEERLVITGLLEKNNV